MKKFKLTVQRTDEYEIHVDEKVWNEEELEKWSRSFWNVETPEELATTLAEKIMRQGSANGFIEGFAYVKTLQNDGREMKQFKEGLKLIEADEYTEGLLVRVITEDEVHDTEIDEII